MITRQRVVTFGIGTLAAATVITAAGLTPWSSNGRPVSLVTPTPIAEPGEPGHRVDVVFAVDTTGSMGGLIDSAKRAVWSIATHIRELDPQADLHVGLVAYRDIGDDYVTKDFALSGDLDAVFASLSSFQASGGGDNPEDVAAGLYDAVHKMAWRDGAKKMMFLVGDAPPADRGDVPRYSVIAAEAGQQQIVVNTIRCGPDRATEVAWREIATLGHGEFSSIEEDGGVHQVATPYDDKLSELSARIDHGAVIVGDDGHRDAYQAKMAATAAAPAPSKADRAGFYGAGARDKDDLVTGVLNGAMDPAAVPPEALPADLRGMTKGALKTEIDRRVTARKAAQAEIQELTKQRAQFLSKHAKGDGFDAKVKSTVDKEMLK